MSIEIANSVARFFASVDRCDWAAVQGLMTDRFHVDYQSYTGEPPAEVSPAELTAAWAGLLPYFDAVHHQIGNLIIERIEEKAQVQAHGMASHYIANQPDGDLQLVVGTYDLHLVQVAGDWKLSAMRFNFKFASGNSALAAEAQARAQRAA